MNVRNGDVIVVWFSCGAASAIAAKKTIEKYSDIATIRVVNNPISEEHQDNARFLLDVESWLNVDIEFATNPKYSSQSCQEVWEKRKFMSGISGAPCTFELKKKARQLWEKNNHHDWIVMGFTLEEVGRYERFRQNERENIIPILINEGITKNDCYRMLIENKIEPPAIYKMGFPNANCIGCVKATSPTYWNLVRRKFPDVFAARSETSRALGAKLVRVNRKRIFLDELSPSATGRPIKSIDFECGIFCEEKDH